MFQHYVHNIKEFFYEEPMEFLGVCLVTIGLLGIVLLGAFLLLVNVGFLVTLAFLSFVVLIVGLVLAGQL